MNSSFVINIEGLNIAFRVFNGRENDIFLYCSLVGRQGKYFFMGTDASGNWKVLPSISLPAEVAAIQHMLSVKVMEMMYINNGLIKNSDTVRSRPLHP